MGRRAQLVLLALSIVAAASMWFYVDRILVVRQRADAAAHDRPRGNLSDLYPRWLGARELLLHHRNPYGSDITAEIQKGYYGRELDPSRTNDPKDQQGFAYPAYVVFLLSPLVTLPFDFVQTAFYWFLALWSAISIEFWLRCLRWRLPRMTLGACVALTLGSFAAVQGIKLQQLSLLVAGLLAACCAAMSGGWLFLGGALLALATIKPQLAWPLVVWILAWAASDWRSRRRFIFGFVLIMTLLLVGSEIILPGWWKLFAGAVDQYRRYTQNQSVVEVMLDQVFALSAGATPGRVGAEVVSVLSGLVCAVVVWKKRFAEACSVDFGRATALVLAFTVLVVPMFAPYNQLLLVPAILVLVRERAASTTRSRGLGLVYAAGLLALGWQWVASFVLSVVCLLGFRDLALGRWQWPFFATFALPVLVFVLLAFQLKAADKRTASDAETV